MITAEFALELGRDVFAVPGPVTSPLAAVPNQLIREGASLARGPEDVLEVLGVEPPGSPATSPGSGSAQVPALDPAESLPPTERRALEAVAGHPVTVDAVAAGTGLAVGEALSALVALELRGLVREVAGRYERTAVGARHR
jgi:DNA processing protein